MTTSASCDEKWTEAHHNTLAVIHSAIADLQADLQKPIDSNEVIPADKMTQISQSLSHDVTKFAVFVGQDWASLSTLVPVSERFTQQVTACICWLRLPLTRASGTLREVYMTAGTRLLSSITTMLNDMERGLEANGKFPLSSTGVVLEQCALLAQLPVYNHQCISKKIDRVLKLVKDARKEMTELKVDESLLAREMQALSTNNDQDNDDMMFDNDDETLLTPQEYEVVKPLLELYVGVFHCLKTLRDHIQQTPVDDDVTDSEYMEQQLQAATSLTRVVDRIGYAVYHPQDLTEITNACTGLRDACVCILRGLKHHRRWNDVDGWVGKVCRVLERTLHGVNSQMFGVRIQELRHLWE